MDINIGDKYEIDYPFINQSDGWSGGHTYIMPGCHKLEGEEDNGWGSVTCVEWVANAEGKICYEVLAIAEMSGKYMDRVIVKYHYQYDGADAGIRAKIKTLTTGKLKSQIESGRVFPCDYEVDADCKPQEIVSHIF